MMHRKQHSKGITVLTIIITILAAVLCAQGGMQAHAQAEERQAEEIIRRCTVRATARNGEYEYLWNDLWGGVFDVSGAGEQSISVELNGNEAAGIYVMWAKGPGPWRLEATLSDGRLEVSDHGGKGILQEYVPLPQNTVRFRIITADGRNHPLRLVELDVFGPGKLPGRVHFWEPTPTTAEIMFIATHQDDEILYFGGAIPYYAGELNYDTVVVYTAFDDSRRLHEALEGLWVCGATQHPVFLEYPDKYSITIDQARQTWNENEVIRSLAGLIVRHKPQVVISQDINGEYGHGQHKLTVHCVMQALDKAENAEYVAGISADAQPWSVSKCYLHLYNQNNISMPWDRLTMTSAGGKSTLEVAREAFQCHVSQLEFDYEVSTTAEGYDCRSFGLYRTRVGQDVNKNDFFENITLRLVNTQPEETVPDYLERVGRTGWLYRCTAERWLQSEYIRHCTVDGVTGWYAADSTGTLLQPVQQVWLVMDDLTLDISAYQTLTQIKDKPRVYSYSDGVMPEPQTVRYCTVGADEAGFYLCDAEGVLVQPAQPVAVSAVQADNRQETIHTEVYGGEPMTQGGLTQDNLSRYLIILVSIMLVVIALVLSISVIRLCAVRKKYRRR